MPRVPSASALFEAAISAEDIETSRMMLLAAVYALRQRRTRKVREEYVRSLLEPPASSRAASTSAGRR